MQLMPIPYFLMRCYTPFCLRGLWKLFMFQLDLHRFIKAVLDCPLRPIVVVKVSCLLSSSIADDENVGCEELLVPFKQPPLLDFGWPWHPQPYL